MIGFRQAVRVARAVVLVALMAVGASAQASRAVSPWHTYQRLLIIVPMTGSGTHADPRRPLYTPAPHEIKNGEGIIAFASLDSDDQKWALVELVALNRAVFQLILADKSIKSFERRSSAKADIESEFGKYRRGFRLEDFHGAVVR